MAWHRTWGRSEGRFFFAKVVIKLVEDCELREYSEVGALNYIKMKRRVVGFLFDIGNEWEKRGGWRFRKKGEKKRKNFCS